MAAQRILPAGEMSPIKPNIILCMTDDQGWGDTGYNGHPVVKTLNRMCEAVPSCACQAAMGPPRGG
jgi:hypothetical protein